MNNHHSVSTLHDKKPPSFYEFTPEFNLKLFINLTQHKNSQHYIDFFNIPEIGGYDNLYQHLNTLANINIGLKIFEYQNNIFDEFELFVYDNINRNIDFIAFFAKTLLKAKHAKKLLIINDKNDHTLIIPKILHCYEKAYKIYNHYTFGFGHLSTDDWNELRSLMCYVFESYSELVHVDNFNNSLLNKLKSNKATNAQSKIQERIRSYLIKVVEKEIKTISSITLFNEEMFLFSLVKIWKNDFNYIRNLKTKKGMKLKLYGNHKSFNEFIYTLAQPKLHIRFKIIINSFQNSIITKKYIDKIKNLTIKINGENIIKLSNQIN